MKNMNTRWVGCLVHRKWAVNEGECKVNEQHKEHACKVGSCLVHRRAQVLKWSERRGKECIA
eukprot:scaffold132280_cov24-Tisochrysis_lutea.AAC.1